MAAPSDAPALMTTSPAPAAAPVPTRPTNRCAVVDLGSNSVRLVVFEGSGRNPVAIFNEKAVLRLGRGLQTTGRLNEAGVQQALRVMSRYAAVATAMGATPFEVLATAAVRDATNGAEFVAGLQARMPGATIRILPGTEEAALSAAGLLCGIPEADGLLADIGGGSLELVRLDAGGVRHAATLRLGVIRLAERAEGDLLRARALADADLAALLVGAARAHRIVAVLRGRGIVLVRVNLIALTIILAIHLRLLRAGELSAILGPIRPNFLVHARLFLFQIGRLASG